MLNQLKKDIEKEIEKLETKYADKEVEFFKKSNDLYKEEYCDLWGDLWEIHCDKEKLIGKLELLTEVEKIINSQQNKTTKDNNFSKVDLGCPASAEGLDSRTISADNIQTATELMNGIKRLEREIRTDYLYPQNSMSIIQRKQDRIRECKAIIKAKRECWQEELYFLRLIYEGSVNFQHECHHSYEEVGKRIEELKKNLEMTESVK